MRPEADSIDTKIMERDGLEPTEFGSTTVDQSFDEAVGEAEQFGAAVDDAEINYSLTGNNSNSYAGTQYEQLTGEDRPSPDVILPGYGRDLCE